MDTGQTGEASRKARLNFPIRVGLFGGGRPRGPSRSLVDQSRFETGKTAPFRRGIDQIIIRKKTMPGERLARPIFRVSKPVKRKAPKPAAREIKTPPKRFQVSPIEMGGFDIRRGPVFVPKAIAKVEPVRPTQKQETDVSIHKSILKGLRGAVTSRVQQKFGAASILPGIGAVGRVLTGRTATAGGIGAAVGSLFGGGGAQGADCPSGWHLNKQDGVGGPAGSYCVRNRRMNFGNARAARRGVRRLKGARKLLKDIEKMMPTKTRTRRAPRGHSEHLHHTGG